MITKLSNIHRIENYSNKILQKFKKNLKKYNKVKAHINQSIKLLLMKFKN